MQKVPDMPSWTLAELAQKVDAVAHGDTAVMISGVCSVENPRAGQIAMAESAEHLEALTSVAAVLHPPALDCSGSGLSHPQPRVVWARLLELFHPEALEPPGTHPSAVVDRRASVDPTAYLGPHCAVGPHAVIGPNCYLQAYVSVGEGARLDAGCRLYAHAVVGENSQLGADCRLEPWAQVGRDARLGPSVDLGAHSSLGPAVEVGEGAKFDNLVVVGARSRIGARCLLVGQSSVERDAVLHPGVVLAGQSAVADAAELASGVQLGGRSLAVGKLEQPGPYLGNPARPLKEEMRARACAKKLQRQDGADAPPL
jgi:UDP-3-O-[3-hydroxymyristoyl] glucosamine N-acyltransferase